jgi:hypothetical protein
MQSYGKDWLQKMYGDKPKMTGKIVKDDPDVLQHLDELDVIWVQLWLHTHSREFWFG